jgi:hypothetical protein
MNFLSFYKEYLSFGRGLLRRGSWMHPWIALTIMEFCMHEQTNPLGK